MGDRSATVLTMLRDGKSYAEIVAATGLSKPTISWHATRAGLGRGPKAHDWPAVQAYHDQGHIRADCMRHFGMASRTWDKAVVRGDLVPNEHRKPVEQLGTRSSVRWRMRKGRTKCQICGLSEWLGEPLSLHLDHINGVKDDHRMENLRWLCPNCHSQTPTYGGRNARRQHSLLR